MLMRSFDILFSLLGMIILSPLFVVIAIAVKADTRGNIFYRQKRVGKDNVDFELYKFRTMKEDSDKKGLLTVGGKDPRITGAGYILRRYKLDELPQLINVLKGEMSFVGPRPEVRKYVELYNDEQKKVLKVKPGITDLASIQYRNENELLKSAENPEEYYIQEIMPDKIKINLRYLNDRSFFKDINVIIRTIRVIFS